MVIGGLCMWANHTITFPVFWIGVTGNTISAVLLLCVSLQWSDSTLFYRSVFQRRSIDLCNIATAKTIQKKGPFTSMYALEIMPAKGSKKKPIYLNIKLFSQKTLLELRAILQKNGVSLY